MDGKTPDSPVRNAGSPDHTTVVCYSTEATLGGNYCLKVRVTPRMR